MIVLGLRLALLADDFTVVNTNEAGAGSLPQAVLDANATAPGPNRILFAIPGPGPFTIQPTNPLLVIRPLTIDGTTQPGYSGTPVIELDGTRVGGLNQGIVVFSGSSTVRGLALNRYASDAIALRGFGGNRIEGNFIGTDLTGTNVVPNGGAGVYVQLGSSGNVIGGIQATQRNIISGSTAPCVVLTDTETMGNLVQGNFLGRLLSSTNTGNFSNLNFGVYILDARSNVIGGSVAGARNVISGNNESGVILSGTNAQGNRVLGNIIGLGTNGSTMARNGGDGVTIRGGIGNIIGGTNAFERNIISGNARAGVYLFSGALSNTIQGNFIGPDLAGQIARTNGYAGVTINASSGNQIGGNTTGARNLISGNAMEGVFIATNSTGNRIEGNWIGVDVSGTNRLGNLASGVTIDSASGNRVGGSSPGARNVISANKLHGIYLTGAAAQGTTIQGNYISTDFTGTRRLGNLFGIWIENSPSHQIGGAFASAGNLISGSASNGVNLKGALTTNVVLQGNFIGTDAAGTNYLGNGGVGVNFADTRGNILGGTTALARNLISGNTNAGISMVAATVGGTTGNRVLGNYIGCDVTGTRYLSNRYEGIFMSRAASNVIGGIEPGAGNLISGNGFRGIYMEYSSWNVFQGNTLGTTVDGYTPLTNGALNHSPTFEIAHQSSNNLIGGTSPGAGNRIAHTPFLRAGIRIRNNGGIYTAAGNGNAILGNTMFDIHTSALGIELGGYPSGDAVGVNPIDPCDTDTGPNRFQNFPTVTNAESGQTTLIRGNLNSAPNTHYRIEFFANLTCHPKGNGPAELYLGSTDVAVGPSCTANFATTLPVAIPAEYTVVTATATDPEGNTSEFSACAPIVHRPWLHVIATPGVEPPGSTAVALAWTWPVGQTPPTLWETESLTPADWRPVNSGITNSATAWSYTSPATNQTRFYRLLVP